MAFKTEVATKQEYREGAEEPRASKEKDLKRDAESRKAAPKRNLWQSIKNYYILEVNAHLIPKLQKYTNLIQFYPNHKY